jgi:pilus assembly protein Flp/PilA
MARERRESHAVHMSLAGLVRSSARFLVARFDLRSEAGATAVEYGLMVMMIAATILIAVVFLGQRTSTTFSCTARQLSTKTSVSGC